MTSLLLQRPCGCRAGEQFLQFFRVGQPFLCVHLIDIDCVMQALRLQNRCLHFRADKCMRYRLPGAKGTVGLISPLSRGFCAQCRRIRITADGMLKSCLHSREELPLRGLHGLELERAIRRGILQKPREHHLAERSSDTPQNMNQIGG